MNNEAFDPFRSTLRLFMSVDIVGSTAFKQTGVATKDEDSRDGKLPAEPWFSPIAQFYRQIELLFAQEWKIYTDKHSSNFGWQTGSPPEFWKGIGDEVVYYKDITHHQEAYCCLHCWINAVNRYRLILQQKFPKLDVKSTAWVAGFPVNNSEIIFRTNVDDVVEPHGGSDAVFDNAQLLKRYYNGSNRSGLVRDFIGPSIDTGFRLAQFASPRKLIVSVDLALLLSSAEGARPREFCYHAMEFYFDGTSLLKGVLGGVPYPIIWVDLLGADSLESAEDRLSRRENVNQAHLRDYCEEFLAKYKARISRPYIRDRFDVLFSEIPERHVDRLSQLKNYFNNEDTRAQDIKTSEEVGNQTGAEIRDDELDSLLKSMQTAWEKRVTDVKNKSSDA